MLLLFLALQLMPAAQGASAIHEATFSHRLHVRENWLKAEGRAVGGDSAPNVEYDRDCRGCHDYSNEVAAQRKPPVDLCNRCHFFQDPEYFGTWRVDPCLEDESKGASGGGERFNHHEHNGLACIACHRPEGDVIPPELPMRSVRSALACQVCHGLDGQAKGKREQLEKGLTARLARRASSDFGAFRHDQHLSPDELGAKQPAKCLLCHFGVLEADRDALGDQQFSTKACQECHQGGRFVTQPYEKESRTAATFLHRAHLGASATPNAALARDSCSTCHAYDAERATFDLGPTFRKAGGELDAYAGCITCHTPVAKHGSIDDCRKCHDFDSLGLGDLIEVWKQRRAKSEVERPAASAFDFVRQAHRFVTGEEIESNPDCKRCHRAPLPSLASRLDGNPFRHETHLPKETEDLGRECLRCHQSMMAAASPADIAFDLEAAEGHALYELRDCKACHRTAALEATSGKTEKRSVLRFAHADHQHRPLPNSGCMDCHVVRGDRIELALDVGDCTKCHSHDQPKTTLGHSRDQIHSCRDCHDRGVPEHGEPAPVKRLRLERIEGKRIHPRAPEKDCSACHHPGAAGAADAVSAGIEYGMKRPEENPTPHAALFQKDSKDAHFIKQMVGNRNTMCWDCHWGNWSRRIANQWPSTLPLPPENEWRAQYGNLLDAGFPGRPLGP